MNKARKNLCEGQDNQNAPDAPTERADLETAERSRLDCKDLSKDLTLDEILSLQTDKEVRQLTILYFKHIRFIQFWRNFQKSPEGSGGWMAERGTVPIYNVNR